MSAADPLNQPAVVLREIAKHFGRFAALRGITAEFAAERLHVILGDNGAGKSTLLRVIAGLTAPSRGRLTVLGAEKIRSVTGRLGYMAHAPLLYDELAGMENLAYFARLYGNIGAKDCEAAITSVGLDPTLKRRVGQYSQGMRQRLSLARAVLNDPALLLLDEPFSNVDVASGRHMVALLGRMRDAGKTVLVVTHQPALLEGVADESVFMSGGTIVARESGVPESAFAAAREVPR